MLVMVGASEGASWVAVFGILLRGSLGSGGRAPRLAPRARWGVDEEVTRLRGLKSAPLEWRIRLWLVGLFCEAAGLFQVPCSGRARVFSTRSPNWRAVKLLPRTAVWREWVR